MSVELDKLEAAVKKLTTVKEGVVTTLRTLAQRIRDLKTDPAKLEALATELDTDAADLGQAVLDNTEAPA